VKDDVLRELVRGGQDIRTAFVAGLGEYESIAGAVCAFLNGDGGTVICGIDVEGRRVGVPAADLQLLNNLENRLQHDITPRPSMTVDVDTDRKVRLVSINVPAGLDAPYIFEGRMLLRKGASIVPADAYELRARVQIKAAQPVRWERRPASNLMFDDLSNEEITRTASAAGNSNLFQFKDPNNPQSILRELAMLGPNELTNAADVAFGLDPAFRNPQCRARILHYASDKTARTGLRDRHFSGPAPRIYDQMLDALRTVLVVRSSFAPEQSEREDRPDFAFDAVREGLINALAHRDYSTFGGGLTVSIFPGRIEIWNSGRLPDELKAKALARTSRSLPVNPDIARVLHYRGFMERIGRGTQLIAEECRKLGAKAPVWKDEASGVTLTIYAAPAREFGTLPLNGRQEAVVRGVRPGEVITPASYRAEYASEVSERQARRDLKEVEQDGYFVRERGGQSSSYRRTDLAPRKRSNWP
jgi:ATP-dependent DNA helicase RecG